MPTNLIPPDLLDALIASGEADSPGFAAKVDAIVARREAARAAGHDVPPIPESQRAEPETAEYGDGYPAEVIAFARVARLSCANAALDPANFATGRRILRELVLMVDPAVLAAAGDAVIAANERAEPEGLFCPMCGEPAPGIVSVARGPWATGWIEWRCDGCGATIHYDGTRFTPGGERVRADRADREEDREKYDDGDDGADGDGDGEAANVIPPVSPFPDLATLTPAQRQFLHDVFVTACEGGINYWATFENYRWAKPERADLVANLEGFRAEVVITKEADGDDNPPDRYVIDAATILAGIFAWINRTVTWGGQPLDPGPNARVSRVVIAWSHTDAGILDAADADNIVQAGLFGDVVYG